MHKKARTVRLAGFCCRRTSTNYETNCCNNEEYILSACSCPVPSNKAVALSFVFPVIVASTFIPSLSHLTVTAYVSSISSMSNVYSNWCISDTLNNFANSIVRSFYRYPAGYKYTNNPQIKKPRKCASSRGMQG